MNKYSQRIQAHTTEANRDILESIYDGYYEVDADGRIIVLNSSLCEILQLEEKDLLGHHYWLYCRFVSRRSLVKLYRTVWMTKRSIRGHEIWFRRLDGKWLALEASATLILHASGIPVGMRGIVRNISDRKVVEQALRESEQRYRSLFENNSDAIIQIDLNGYIVDANHTTTDVIGYPTAELKGQCLEMFLSSDEATKIRGGLERNDQADLSKVYEVKASHCDGQLVHLQVKIVPIRVNGRIVGAYVMCRDVTAQLRAEAMLVRSEKLSIVGQLAAGVAHEIRNPLSALKGFLQLCAKTPSSLAKYISIMYSEVERIEEITSDLLTFSKPSVPVLQTVRVVDIINGVRDLLSSLALMRGVEFDVSFDHDSEPLRCDHNRIRQVLVNIAKNAIDSMQGGGVVRICTRDVGWQVEISVQDTGAGMTEDTLRHIGEPFYTTKQTGTGLGVMVCQRIVESHNGTIHWDSRPGEGTTVTIKLPRTQH